MSRPRRRGRDINGVLLLDKPQGMSSNDALQKVKRIYNANRAGHTGALDPLATGMLPICLGEATKFSQYLLDSDKRYRVIARLGQRTDTSDADGQIVEERPVTFSAEQLAAALDTFRGDIVLCGFEYGRVRAMRNELGQEVLEAGPSIPVEILGLSGVPAAGDEVTVVRDEKKAREVALYRQGKFREVKLARQQKSKLENMFANMTEGEVHEVNIVLKADVQGSVEAISDSLLKLSTDEVKVKIIGSGVGGITETDATLAAASNAILVGFNVRADASARKVIEAESLDLRYYSVIYNLIDEVKAAMSGMLSPELKQQIIGLAEVRDVFKSPKFGAIAGCMVTEGVVKRHNPIRVLRDNVVIYEGELESLRRFKDDVNEVRNGMECGIGVKNYNDVRTGDVIEVFEIIEIQRTIA